MINLRPAQASDASALAALSIEVWMGTYLRSGITTFFADFALSHYTPAKFTAAIESPDQNLLVATAPDGFQGLIGFIQVSQNAPGPVAGCSDTEILHLYVQPRHHGKGLGSALLQTALPGPVWLTTNAENTGARAFYRAHGFSEIGETFFEIEDEKYPNTVLACPAT